MKKLISGMFSSVPDAQLLLATTGYDEEAPENAVDKFDQVDSTSSLNQTKSNAVIETQLSDVPKQTINSDLE